jgi:sigma-B regulation protein RsbU (phosphoserine phosphatase)
MDNLNLPYLRKQLNERKDRLEHSAKNLTEPVKIYRLLQQIDRTLERIDKGSYGICEVCHDPIEPERLAYDPMISVCLDHLNTEQQRALEQDLELAARVQQGLLPKKNIIIDGWEFSYRYNPAGIVSGDFCDFVKVEGNSFFFVLGDVSGKGISASLMMSQLHALIRSFVTFGLPLQEIVRRTNRLFCESILSNNYATMVFGKGTPDGLIEFCIAGHNPPILLKEKNYTRIKATGVPVGLFCSAEYEISSYSLAAGDTVLIYTDGLTESYADGSEYGENRLIESLLQSVHQPPDLILDSLFQSHTKFMKSAKPADDVTVAVLRKA